MVNVNSISSLWLGLLPFACCMLTCHGEAWTPESFHRLTTMDGVVKCGRSSPQHVCNPDDVLNQYEVGHINDLVERLTNVSGNGYVTCGARHLVTSVVVVGQIFVDDKNLNYFKYAKHNKDDELTIATMQKFQIKVFSHYLRDVSWRLGSKDCGEDIYLVLTTNPVDIFVSAGQQATKKLTDSCVKEILNSDRIRNYKIAKEYENMLTEALQQISDLLMSDSSQCGNSLVLTLVLSVGISFIVISVICLIVYQNCVGSSKTLQNPKEKKTSRKQKKNGKSADRASLTEESEPWLGETSQEVHA